MLLLRVCLLFALCLPLSVASQITDDFSDGNFNSDPQWFGDVGNYIVNGDLQLQLNGGAEAFSYLTTPLLDGDLSDKEWNFFIRLNFSPSANNNSRVYLSSMIDDLTYSNENSCGAQGYFLQFGESGSDDALRLYRDDTFGGSPIELGNGPEGVLSSSFEVRVRVVRDDLGNWEVYMDPTGGENYQLQMMVSDNTYSTGVHMGVVGKYTSSNVMNIYYDDFYYGDEILDLELPFVVGSQVLSSTEVEVTFNEALNESSAEETSNYNLVGIGVPLGAVLDDVDFKTVTLTFATDFPEGVEQVLEISSIEDLSENPMLDDSVTFTWVVPAIAEFKSIVFNEILADPTPAVDLPEVEYVELYNATDEAFDLSNWKFVNTVTELDLPTYIMGPDSYLLLCDIGDEASLLPYGSVIGLSSFPALSNLEDSLTLISSESLIVDAVHYTIEWYDQDGTDDGGYSLELKNPLSPCPSSSANWGSSLDLNGGTPGEINSIYSVDPDSNPPAIVSVSLEEPNVLLVSFDDVLDPESVLLENFSISSDLLIEEVNVESSSELELVFDMPLELATDYVLTLSTISDCEGNTIEQPIDFSFIIGFVPEPGDLIINEIMADPDVNFPSPNAEYIELYNKSDLVLELKGTTISGALIDEGFALGPDEYVVITSSADLSFFSESVDVIGLLSFPALTNSGRELDLINANLEDLDYLEYDISWYQNTSKDDGGYSLELINPEDPCSDSDNWRASEAISGATEGELNSVNDVSPDEVGPEILNILPWSDTQLEVIFTEPYESNNLDTWTFEITSETGEPGFEVTGAQIASNTSVFIDLSASIDPIHVWDLEIFGLSDCWGNSGENLMGSFSSVDPYEEGDLIINEVLFDPRTDAEDYVEIYNISERNISLNGWFLANVDDGLVDNLKLITELPRVILKNSYVVLTTSAQGVISEYPFTVQQAILEIESSPTYSNDEGTVVLINPEGEVADRFDYSSDYHFALLDEVDGVSLERIRFDEETNNPNNWHSAAESQNFGTPGYLNSQSILGGASTGQFEIFPEVFSPDNDGYEDVTTLSYQLDEPGFVGNVRIFDRSGREIRHLVKNELLGKEGLFNWDGLNEQGEKSPIGIYVVQIEIYDLEGKSSRERLTCVVGAFLD